LLPTDLEDGEGAGCLAEVLVAFPFEDADGEAA